VNNPFNKIDIGFIATIFNFKSAIIEQWPIY